MPYVIRPLLSVHNKVLLSVNDYVFVLSRQKIRIQDNAKVFSWVCWRKCGARFRTTITNEEHVQDTRFFEPPVHTHAPELATGTEHGIEHLYNGDFLSFLTKDEVSIEDNNADDDDDDNDDDDELLHPMDSDDRIHSFCTQQLNAMAGLPIETNTANASQTPVLDQLADRQFLGLPPEFEKTLSGQQFYIRDTGTGPNRIIILSTVENLEYLSESKFWMANGVYKNFSGIGRYIENFIQVFTIHGDIKTESGTICMPLVFSLLTYPTELTYRTMFAQLNEFALENGIDFSQNDSLKIVTDLNVYAINALKSTFPFATHTISFYHFSQNIHDQLQVEENSTNILDDCVFNMLSHQLPALAFLPASKIVEGWKILRQSIPTQCVDCNSLIEHFEMTYISRSGEKEGDRLPPLFEPQSWSIWTSVDDEYMRTNIFESWNCRLERLIYRQPGLENMISQLQHVQNETENTIAQAIEGTLSLEKTKDVHLETIKILIHGLQINQNADIGEFLRCISNHINFKSQYPRGHFNIFYA